MFIFEDVRNGPADRNKYLDAWLTNHALSMGKSDAGSLDAAQKEQAVCRLCDKLYDDLSILDNKSNALTASNAVVTAFLSLIVVAGVSAERILSPFLTIASALLLTLSVTSLVLNISVVSLYWTKAEDLEEGRNPRLRAEGLLEVRNSRTKRYRLAFLSHLFVLAIVFLLTVVFLLRLADA